MEAGAFGEETLIKGAEMVVLGLGVLSAADTMHGSYLSLQHQRCTLCSAATGMRKSVGTRAEALVNEHKHTCPPMLSGLCAFAGGMRITLVSCALCAAAGCAGA